MRHFAARSYRPDPWIAVIFALAGLTGGCESGSSRTTEGATRDALGGVREAEKTVQEDRPRADRGGGADTSRPAATLIGRPIHWGDVTPRLSEAAGAAVMEELTIDALAQRELTAQGLSVSPGDIDAEESLLIAAVTRTGTSPAQTAELMNQMKKARGLGPVRYRALLERNAMLRRLVRDDCEPTSEQLSQGMEVRYGPRHIARIIVTGSPQDAAAIHARLAALPAEARPAAFAAEAFSASVDPSKDRGGLLEPISPSDASYAAAVRGALPGLGAGQLSPIIALDNGYALLLGIETIPAQSPPADAQARVRTELRARLERAAMDQLARRLLMATPPTMIDPSLNWAWEARSASGR